MKCIDILFYIIIILIHSCLFIGCNTTQNWQWKTIEAIGEPTPRHEAAFVAYDDKLYLLGGRRINPTDEFDTKTNTWTAKSEPPVEIHHFQSVVVGDAIYIIGAMTGKWLTERPLERVLIYYLSELIEDKWHIYGGGKKAGFKTLYSTTSSLEALEL